MTRSPSDHFLIVPFPVADDGLDEQAPASLPAPAANMEPFSRSIVPQRLSVVGDGLWAAGLMTSTV